MYLWLIHLNFTSLVKIQMLISKSIFLENKYKSHKNLPMFSPWINGVTQIVGHIEGCVADQIEYLKFVYIS
jgi:hypothetical protein